MSHTIIVKSSKAPYVVFSIIMTPLIVLSVYVALKTRIPVNYLCPLIAIAMLLLILYYLSSLKLCMTDDQIVYGVLWGSRQVPISSVRSIERVRSRLGGGATWVVKCVDGNALLVNITNFKTADLHDFTRMLTLKKPEISVRI